jgi:hypothetical protein
VIPLANIGDNQRTMVTGGTTASVYSQPWIDGPGTGRIHFAADSSSTTNWGTNEVTFKKVMFTQPVTITSNTNYDPVDVTNEIIIHANEQAQIRFDECFFGSTDTAVTFTTNSASSTDSIYLYDDNGNLITDRNGILNQLRFNHLSPEERRRQEFINRIRNKQAPAILNHRGRTARSAQDGQRRFANARPEELVALQLLRRMVPGDVFKKYLKHGFVTVQGPSGLVYQIRRGHDHIKVWKQGQLVSELCVHLRDRTIPPTDEVVAKMVIVECDEIDIWRRANIYWQDALSEFQRLNRNTIEERHLRLVA